MFINDDQQIVQIKNNDVCDWRQQYVKLSEYPSQKNLHMNFAPYEFSFAWEEAILHERKVRTKRILFLLRSFLPPHKKLLYSFVLGNLRRC